jgi:hypothetical protein
MIHGDQPPRYGCEHQEVKCHINRHGHNGDPPDFRVDALAGGADVHALHADDGYGEGRAEYAQPENAEETDDEAVVVKYGAHAKEKQEGGGWYREDVGCTQNPEQNIAMFHSTSFTVGQPAWTSRPFAILTLKDSACDQVAQGPETADAEHQKVRRWEIDIVAHREII